MSTQIVPTAPHTVPKLTEQQVRLMLAHILRVPELFRLARQTLRAADFTTERHCHILWKVASDLANRHGSKFLFGELPAVQKALTAECQAYIQTQDPATVPDQVRQAVLYRGPQEPGVISQHPGLISWIYESLTEADLQADYGKELLEKFLHERQLHLPLRKLFRAAEDSVITNLDSVLDIARQQSAVHQQLKAGGHGTLAGEWGDFQNRLQVYRGRQMIGLETGLQELDKRTLGLRGLMVLGAGPGVGKTTYALQMGLGVCRQNADAVFLVISLEMDKSALYTRLLCNQAQLDWKTVMLGSESCRREVNGPWFTPKDQSRLERAQTQLVGTVGSRIMILDRTNLKGDITTDTILGHLADLKHRAGAKRAFIVLDYLQRLPVPEKLAKKGDLEADRHRVQVVQDLVEATKTGENPVGDALLVISEARKPSGGKHTWGNGLADLMGSARLPYAVDAALLFHPMKNAEQVNKHSWPSVSKSFSSIEELNCLGVSPVSIELAKGRDGMQRGEWAMAFHFLESRFVEAVPGGHPTIDHYEAPVRRGRIEEPFNLQPALDPFKE
jgi:hypothetical protein